MKAEYDLIQDEVAQEPIRFETQEARHHAPFQRRCRRMAEQAGVPYQSLINLYLRDCVTQHRQVQIAWPSKP